MVRVAGRSTTRATLGALAALVVGVGTACGGGGGSIPGLGGDHGFCTVSQRLPAAAEFVDAAAVDDPDAFDESFQMAVDDYVQTLQDLRERGPSSLRRDLDLLISAVQQYKFDDALTAAEPLRRYLADHCESPTTTTSPAP